jgi:hypothetical protein
MTKLYLAHGRFIDATDQQLQHGDLAQHRARIREIAEDLAGTTRDVVQRAAALRAIYLETGGRHCFPLLGAHAALWGHCTLMKMEGICRRLGLSTGSFCDGIRDLGRCIFLDVYTDYHFSRLFGDCADADAFIHPTVLERLNRMHESVRLGVAFNVTERRQLYESALLREQEAVVAPRVSAEFDMLGSKVLVWISRHPIVRFKFFPIFECLWFSDFTCRKERIEKAMKTHQIAEKVGWPMVLASLQRYPL